MNENNEKINLTTLSPDTYLLQYLNDDCTIKEDAPLYAKVFHAAIILKMSDYVNSISLDYLRNTRLIDLSASKLARRTKERLNEFYVKTAGVSIAELAKKQNAEAEQIIKELEELKGND